MPGELCTVSGALRLGTRNRKTGMGDARAGLFTLLAHRCPSLGRSRQGFGGIPVLRVWVGFLRFGARVSPVSRACRCPGRCLRPSPRVGRRPSGTRSNQPRACGLHSHIRRVGITLVVDNIPPVGVDKDAPGVIIRHRSCPFVYRSNSPAACLTQHFSDIGMAAVIPPRSNRKQPRSYDDHLYRERHLVECFIGKKISGGARSERGSETKSILASLFGTWRLQERNPYQALQSILSKPHLAPV